MAAIEKFLGQRVEVQEDLRYDVKQGLWGRCVDQTIVFGLTQPALLLSGGVKDLDWLIEDGQAVGKGEAILFAITGKIFYMEAPLAGKVQFNKQPKKDPAQIAADPYGQGWLFFIVPSDDFGRAYQSLASPEVYLDALRRSEGGKNPEGIKGGVSGICKAVYTGIGEQKI